MADIINFGVERAKRKSGIKNTAYLEEMVKEGYDPCNPKDIQSIKKSLQNVINNKSRRAEMIKKGKKLAAENTLDKRALELYEFIKSEINLR